MNFQGTIDNNTIPGLNSSLASLILISVSAATVSFSLTSAAVTFEVDKTWISDSSSTSEPYIKQYHHIIITNIITWIILSYCLVTASAPLKNVGLVYGV